MLRQLLSTILTGVPPDGPDATGVQSLVVFSHTWTVPPGHVADALAEAPPSHDTVAMLRASKRAAASRRTALSYSPRWRTGTRLRRTAPTVAPVKRATSPTASMPVPSANAGDAPSVVADEEVVDQTSAAENPPP